MRHTTYTVLLGFFALLLFSATVHARTRDKITDIPVSSSSKEAVTAFRQALAFFDEGNTIKARAAVLKALEKDPHLAIAHIYKAFTESAATDWIADLDNAKANLAGASDWEKMYYDLVSTYLTNNWEKRLEIAHKIADKYPDAARPQVDLGYVYLSANKYEEAKAAFQKAVNLNPNWIGGYYALVNLYTLNDVKDFQKAVQYGQKAVAVAPSSAGAQLMLGNSYQGMNDFDKAKAAYNKAISLDADVAGAYYNLGAVNNLGGNYEEARKNFTEAGKHDVNQIGAILNIANTYLYEGDYKKAINWLEESAAKQDASGNDASKATLAKINFISTASVIAWYNNDLEKLKALVTQLEPLDTQFGNEIGTDDARLNFKADVSYWQGIIATMEGNYDAALAKAEEIKTTKEPLKDPMKLQNYEFLKGYIAMKKKAYTEAVAQFEKMNQNDIQNKYWLALANEGAGNKAKADALFNEVANYRFDTFSNALVHTDVLKKVKP